ncbi:TetR/AcrR family transcriptional regulator [Chondrinema litorale]|uniref:TetR/AcrR family transcriptional regulator n=1 Tax=Chondrinema litorale TaxID=2994555 RepID=UPI0025426DB3|nr:TetR/AcrR family transcriptional regulator [Chondrinema litorale]UZR99944.1 TetR/AcrR family transcriptional regulator [Chondrinema litorale]
MLDKKEERKKRVREAIKQAALEIAESEGWHKVTIRRVADKVLYTPPIVYEFFKNKDDLYRHIVKDGFELLINSTYEKINAQHSAEDKLCALALARFEFVTKHNTLHHMMFDADNPEWHNLELSNYMIKIKGMVLGLLTEITGEEDEVKVQEYFLNMVCLLKGYTFFKMHDNKNIIAKRKSMLLPDMEVTDLFLAAFKRFINSIKS